MSARPGSPAYLAAAIAAAGLAMAVIAVSAAGRSAPRSPAAAAGLRPMIVMPAPQSPLTEARGHVV